jgi:Tfp pilus assembly protein PilF/O-antigen ligase
MNDFLKVVVYGGLFTIPFLTLFVANDYFFPFITGKNFAFRIIVEIVFVAWAVLALADTQYRPKFSWIFSSFSLLLVVMFFANLFGQHPQTSFWSNFERMDGYVTLVHMFMYLVVLGSVITTKKIWNYYLHATLLAALITAVYGLAQFTGTVGEVAGGRIESYLGNAAYLSIYMLFHVFLAFWMFVESKVTLHRVAYALLAVLFTYVLMNSGTRGTVLGLGVGVGVMVTYIALFASQYREYRKYAIGALVFLVIGAGTLVFGKDLDFIQNNPNLARVANIDLSEDLKVRGTIWMMAWEGVKERPLLGWGQSNFNYVFNQEYVPFLYDQEQWFDRAHSIVFDWLIAGGFLGFLAYISILLACVYYLFIAPLVGRFLESFNALERGVLLGILAGYFTHNLVVFDNMVSYMFFMVVLALIHSRVAEVMPAVQNFKLDKALLTQFVAPVALVVMVLVVYFVNVPAMRAATDIIDGYRATVLETKLAAFEQAVARNSFAQQEIAEQIAQQAMMYVRDQNMPEAQRLRFIKLAEEELLRLVAMKPGDARIHVFMGSFYRSLGENTKAAEQMAIARELSPNKPSIITQQAVIAYTQGDLPKATEWFEEAWRLDERNLEALEFYIAMLFLQGRGAEAKELVTSEAILARLAKNDFVVNTINQSGDTGFLIEIYKAKLAADPKVEQTWASLAFLYYQAGDKVSAAATLREAASISPAFAKTANCYADNIEAGKEPQDGCQ